MQELYIGLYDYYGIHLDTKYKQPLLTPQVIDFIMERFQRGITKKGVDIEIISFGTEAPDHLHVLVRCKYISHEELNKVLNDFKSDSSSFVQKEFTEIRAQLTNNKFWRKGYLVEPKTYTSAILNLKTYIENKPYHKTVTYI